MSAGRILVTGASGFIGGHLARELRADGAVGASRSTQRDSSIEWAAPFETADVLAARRALREVEVLVHAGGRAHVMREAATDPLQAFREANVATTRALVDAASAEGVRRIILLSSISVYGDGAPEMLDESTPTQPTTPYGQSRLEAEEEVHRARSGIEVVVLRLPMVYGSGMKGNPLRLFNLVDREVLLPLGAIRNARSMIHAGNVVAAVRGLLSAPAAAGATLLAADVASPSTPLLVQDIAAALGRRSRLVSVPLPLLRLAAATGTALLGKRSPLTPLDLWRLCASLVVDSSALGRILGGPLPVSRTAGLKEAAQWYRTAIARVPRDQA